ncbi:hypothetical protein [Scytonema sp. NUACC26]|uniref:hypothetical protein n=1 Tax=Scytonema sp. NUACC26 TaxID=3140176 RepID=UPI0034DB912F
MFSLRNTLANRQLPPGYRVSMGIVVLCGRRPVSITRLRNSLCPESVIVHFKSLVPINNNVNQFIDTQFVAMQRLFAESDVAVLRGTTEDLSSEPALQILQNLDVGQCLLGQPTQEQNDLFANRNNVGTNDLIIYIVANLVDASGGAGNFLGCATHPDGQPGAAVVQANARWLVAHEVGHVLELRHVEGNSDSLMFLNVGWTNVPPDLSNGENATMRNSGLTLPC